MRSLEGLVSPDESLLAHNRAAQVEIVVPVRDVSLKLPPPDSEDVRSFSRPLSADRAQREVAAVR